MSIFGQYLYLQLFVCYAQHRCAEWSYSMFKGKSSPAEQWDLVVLSFDKGLRQTWPVFVNKLGKIYTERSMCINVLK